MPYADLGDPQTLNLYAYGRNNPVTSADADGHTPVDDIWEATGHMDQEVGFGFHFWAGQDEGAAKGDGCPKAGCTVTVVGRVKALVALVWALQRWDSAQLWSQVKQEGQHLRHPFDCNPCRAMIVPPFGDDLELLSESVSSEEILEDPAVRGTLKQIESGTTKGRVFQNKDGQLPQQGSGYYRRYTVKSGSQPGRGAERLITGQDGEVYYTSDHYKTFVRLK